MDLPRQHFIDRFKKWMKEFNGGNFLDVQEDPEKCPLHAYVLYNKLGCHSEMVGTTTKCPLCGNYMCPDCNNHRVKVLSRVTGYMSDTSGWNSAKRQELDDRTRYQV